jgi:hypothetical protein
MTKSWYKSKLLWLGVIQFLGAGLLASMEADASWQSIALAAFGVITAALRANTTKQLTK